MQKRRQCCRSCVLSVNFEHTSQFVPVFLLLTLNRLMKWQKQWHNEKMGRWLRSKCFLVIVPDYHIQGKDQITFASSQWSFTSLIYIQLSELHSIAKPQVFPDLKILVLGASLSRNKFLTIPGDLVNEGAINREVNVRGGPMSGGYSTSIDLKMISS